MQRKLSAASRRRAQFDFDCEFFCQFQYEPALGLGEEEGVCRRDPSSVIRVGDLYYVWYTRSEGESYGYTGDPTLKVWPWDLAEIWYATSPDGRSWAEQGKAVGPGAPGEFDDRSVFTSEILAHEGSYYLVYQAGRTPYTRRHHECVAMAVAASPRGPWRKLPNPILEPARDGEWEGDEDDAYAARVRGSFDSQNTHDPCLVHYDGRFWLYYKGEQMGTLTWGSRWGVAVSERPEGPYVKSVYNPVSNSGHETCVWHYDGGIAALMTTVGWEKDTIQWAPDGINFEVKAHVSLPPVAAGPFRPGLANIRGPLDGLQWGLCHVVPGMPAYESRCSWDHIMRFSASSYVRDVVRGTS
jgi:hypothetical protein